MPSLTPTTAGNGNSYVSRPASDSRCTCATPSSIVSPLPPLTIGRPSAWATRIPTWNPPESADSLPNRIRSNGAVGRLDLSDGGGDRLRGALRIPVALGDREQHRLRHPHRHRVAQLLLGLGRAQRQHGRLATVLLDELRGCLDRALLVRRRGERKVGGVDVLPVGGDVDPRARSRHPLHAHQNSHAGSVFMRLSSGSNRGWLPTLATVTGYCSFM